MHGASKLIRNYLYTVIDVCLDDESLKQVCVDRLVCIYTSICEDVSGFYHPNAHWYLIYSKSWDSSFF